MTAAVILPLAPAKMPANRHLERASQPHRPVRTSLERIVLTGFMGSGKSTVGAILAEQLGWTFLDLDREIERRCGMSIPAIFAELGEAQFRKQEASALASVLGRTHIVIALGGGVPETLGNRLLLEQTPATTVVFLDAPFAVLHERCLEQAKAPGATARPLLANRDQAEVRFNTRRGLYAKVASLRIETTDLAAANVAELLLGKLRHPE